MTSVASTADATGRPAIRRARRVGPLAAIVAAVALLATACGGGPGTQEEFNEILTRGDNLTAEEADCISTAVFDRYGEDQDALGKLSAAPDIEFLDGPDGIPGFNEFFDSTVDGCLQVGPSN